MVNLCGGLATHGASVTLVTLSDSESDFYPVSPSTTRVPLDVLHATRSAPAALRATWHRLRVLRTAIMASRPDVVLSFMDSTNVLVLLALLGTNIPVVVAERNNPWMLPIGRVWAVLRRITYRLAHRITIQTDELRAFFPRGLQTRIRVIPNAVVCAPQSAVPRQPIILAAGRLEPQKGFDVLINAFALASPAIPDWTLRIVGEGSQRHELEALRTAAGAAIAARVSMPGRSASMAVEYARASIFVLASRFEGFPNVLCEAMAHGCAAVATRCRTGPSEIVRDGIDGILIHVDDVSALAAEITSLAQDDSRRSALGAAARSLPDRFSETAINRRWFELLTEAAKRH